MQGLCEDHRSFKHVREVWKKGGNEMKPQKRMYVVRRNEYHDKCSKGIFYEANQYYVHDGLWCNERDHATPMTGEKALKVLDVLACEGL